MTPVASPARVIALAGRPNTGKTSLFNALTGLRQRVANFAGCTVEKASGFARDGRTEAELVDLPGTFSFLPQTEDEKVSFRYLSECAPADLLVLCVAEASNLENDLVLPAGLRAAGYTVAVAVNMIDEARVNGIKIDAARLAKSLGCPVALLSARTGEGLGAARRLFSTPRAGAAAPLDFRKASKTRLHELQDEAIAAAHRAAHASVTRPRAAVLKTLSRSIDLDRRLLHPVLGPLILAGTMFLLFQALFAGAQPFVDLLESALAAASEALRAALPPGALASFLCDGALPGISAVVVFVPQIAILFTLIGFLEQSGYLPRAGAMVDRALRPFGLDGRVFIPFLSGFACAIPGVMAARTIPNERRRLITILLTPLMTCSARLPVYTLLIGAFVPGTFRPLGFDGRGVVMAGMYAFGVANALLLALALKALGVNDEPALPATILPTYRVPGWREVARYAGTRCWHFLDRAGRVIFTVSLVLWVLAAFPRREAPAGEDPKVTAAEQVRLSALGRAGAAIEPVFRPLGWDWRVSIASLSALAAREVFVGTLGTIYALGGESEDSDGLAAALRDAKKADGSPRYGLPVAVGLLIFFAIALQCVSTIAIVRRETGGWAWPAAQFAGFFVLAYALAFAGVRLTAAYL